MVIQATLHTVRHLHSLSRIKLSTNVSRTELIRMVISCHSRRPEDFAQPRYCLVDRGFFIRNMSFEIFYFVVVVVVVVVDKNFTK